MPPRAIFGFGTLLQMGDGATPTEGFTTIAEVRSLGGPSMSADIVDVTSHSSPSRVREKIQGLVDAGEIPFTVSFIPDDATHDHDTGLLAAFLSGSRDNYQIVIPTETPITWGINAIVSNFDFTFPIDDAITADVTLTLTGVPVFP